MDQIEKIQKLLSGSTLFQVIQDTRYQQENNLVHEGYIPITNAEKLQMHTEAQTYLLLEILNILKPSSGNIVSMGDDSHDYHYSH